MSSLHVPAGIQTEIREYYAYIWSRARQYACPLNFLSLISVGVLRLCGRRGSVVNDILGDLSHRLSQKLDVCIQTNRLRKFQVFDGVSTEFIREMCPRLDTIFLSREDRLIVEGESEFSTYLLDDGVLEVSTRALGHVCTLRPGAIVGEMAYFMGCSCRSATVQTKEGGIVFELTIVMLRSFCLKFPRLRHSMNLLAVARLQRLRELTASQQRTGSLIRTTSAQANNAHVNVLLDVGAVVQHPERGKGIVRKVDFDDARGKPVAVEFNGVLHHYSGPSTRKLKILRGPPGSDTPLPDGFSSSLIRFPMLQLSSAQPGLVHLKSNEASTLQASSANGPLKPAANHQSSNNQRFPSSQVVEESVCSDAQDSAELRAADVRLPSSAAVSPEVVAPQPPYLEGRSTPCACPLTLEELAARMARVEDTVNRIEWHLMNSVQITTRAPMSTRGVLVRGASGLQMQRSRDRDRDSNPREGIVNV
jgi:CRP-like cAMP-binding protein